MIIVKMIIDHHDNYLQTWCRLLHIVTTYLMLTTYSWMLCEGTYLKVILVGSQKLLDVNNDDDYDCEDHRLPASSPKLSQFQFKINSRQLWMEAMLSVMNMIINPQLPPIAFLHKTTTSPPYLTP